MKTTLFLLSFLGITVLSNAQIIHVPASQPTIQAGIDAASDGDTVLVEDNTYLENINFNGKAITVASHFIMDGDTNHINNTVIDGSQPERADFGSCVTFIMGEDTTSVLCGFTITGGTGMVVPMYEARAGGGIACYNASARIIHNKVTNNQVESSLFAWGGGIACIRENEDSWMVVESNIITDNATLAEGMTATGRGIEIWGNARISNNRIDQNHCICSSGLAGGGGVVIDSISGYDSWLYFNDNLVRNNSLESDLGAQGGGLFVRSSHAVINNNQIDYNSINGESAFGGGLVIYRISYLEMKYNEIIQNQINSEAGYNWYGAGLYCFQPFGSVHLLNNDFSYNTGLPEGLGRGGGICIRYAYENEVWMDANLVSNNHCFRGGGLYEESCHNLSLTNNIFSENTATSINQGQGGGIAVYNPGMVSVPQTFPLAANRCHIFNNTFYHNSADWQGGALHYNGALCPPAIINCIFFENESPVGQTINNITPLSVVVSNSNIDTTTINGPWTGVENINVDPLFIPGDTLYHVSGTSPCINTGTDSIEINGFVYYAPLSDYDGEPRPDCLVKSIDMGADELYRIPAPVALDPADVGEDYFEARWTVSDCASGYYLDVAYDENFNDYVTGYENLDAWNDTIWTVSDLEASEYYYRVRAYNAYGTSEHSNVIQVVGVWVEELQVAGCRLQVFPNPSSGRSEIKYQIAEIKDQLAVGSPAQAGSPLRSNWQLAIYTNVRITLHEIFGKQVRILLNEAQVPREHTLYFDTTGLPAGIYLILLQAGDAVATQKLVVLSN
jgi:hypothetical protein